MVIDMIVKIVGKNILKIIEIKLKSIIKITTN